MANKQVRTKSKFKKGHRAKRAHTLATVIPVTKRWRERFERAARDRGGESRN
jgi:hypothetical protein